MSKIISINNNKGGVLKTTTVLAISSVLAKKYQKNVLILDTDFQSNISTAFGIKSENLSLTFYDLLSKEYDQFDMEEKFQFLDKSIIEDVYTFVDDEIAEKRKKQKLINNQIKFLEGLNSKSNKVMKKIEFLELEVEILEKEIKLTTYEKRQGTISILPSNHSDALKDVDFSNDIDSFIKQVKEFINYLKNKEEYDYIIVDSPPNLNIVQENILNTVDSVIIPLEMEYYSLKGLNKMIKLIENYQSNNPELKIEAIIPVKVNSRSKLHKEVFKSLEISLQMKDKRGGDYFDKLIPLEKGVPISIQDASSLAFEGKPLLLTKNYDKIKLTDKISNSYLNLIETVL